jgi:hypothetical protein
MPTYGTYEQIGQAEDVSDIISNISPTKTPFQSSIGNEKVSATLFEWQEDSLRAVANNAVAEAADATDVAIVPTVMRNNRTQILQETVKVSGTADAVKTYGRAKEMAYQMAKSSAQVKRDLENAFVGTAQTAVTGDNTTPTARKMAGFQRQLDASSVIYTHATVDNTALSEAKLVEMLQACFTNGAEPSQVQVTPSNSVVVANFASASGRYRTINTGGSDKTIVNAVNLYVSPFGEQKISINRFLRDKNTIAFDPEQWAKATLRPWSRTPLAKTGDSTREQILGEFSLKHKNYKASGCIVEKATSTGGFA